MSNIALCIALCVAIITTTTGIAAFRFQQHQRFGDHGIDITTLKTFSGAVKSDNICPCAVVSADGIGSNCTGPATKKIWHGCRPTLPGKPYEAVFFNYTNPAMDPPQHHPSAITSLWCTSDLLALDWGNDVMSIYVDGEEKMMGDDASIVFPLFEAHALFGDEEFTKPWSAGGIVNKLSLNGGLSLNFPFPFAKSIIVTVKLAPSSLKTGTSHGFYLIAHGIRNAPTILANSNYRLPPQARLKVQRTTGVLPPHKVVTLMNSSSSSSSGSGGVIFLLTMLMNSKVAHYLEGEFKAVLDGEKMTLSSGFEDFFESAQYFSGGPYHTPFSACNKVTPGCWDGLSNCSVAALRIMSSPDPVIWSKSAEFLWQVGDSHWHVDPVDARILVFYYEW